MNPKWVCFEHKDGMVDFFFPHTQKSILLFLQPPPPRLNQYMPVHIIGAYLSGLINGRQTYLLLIEYTKNLHFTFVVNKQVAHVHFMYGHVYSMCTAH